LSGCMKDKDQERIPEAVVTMVNGFVSSNGVTYAVDNTAIQYSYNPLLYQKYDWFRLFPGNRRLRIFTDTEQLLSDETFTFKDSTYYTSFIYGWQDDVHHLLTEDKILDNLGDKSASRFFHLSPAEDKVNIYLDNKQTPLYTDRGYEGENATDESKANTAFVPQSSGKHTIIVTDKDNETLVEREYTFEKGRHYSLILIGDKSMARPLYLGVVSQYNP